MANFLVVDDSSTMRKIIAKSLRQADLAVDQIWEAADGFEALEVLADGRNEVHLILSDINMPNMDGLEFVGTARRRGYRMPIEMITTEGGEDVLATAMQNGACASIKKPFTPEALRSVLGPLL